MKDTEMPSFTMAISELAMGLGAEFKVEHMEFYWKALRDLPLLFFRRSCERAARECRFMPKPAELRVFAVEEMEIFPSPASVEANRKWLKEANESLEKTDAKSLWHRARLLSNKEDCISLIRFAEQHKEEVEAVGEYQDALKQGAPAHGAHLLTDRGYRT